MPVTSIFALLCKDTLPQTHKETKQICRNISHHRLLYVFLQSVNHQKQFLDMNKSSATIMAAALMLAYNGLVALSFLFHFGTGRS